MTKITFAIASIGICLSAHAFTSEELMEKALSQGKAQGVLTGKTADQIREITHSVEPTQAMFERLEDKDGCQFFKLTVTQPNIPRVGGGFAGDFVTVSRVSACRGSRQAPPTEVLDCHIGIFSCMPKN